MKQFTIHRLIRWSATAAVIVLCLRRILFLTNPGLLPSEKWQPNSVTAKWIGIAINSLSELVLLLVLLGLPFCLYASYRMRHKQSGSKAAVLDALFSAIMYATAYFLLAPPKLS